MKNTSSNIKDSQLERKIKDYFDGKDVVFTKSDKNALQY